MTTGATDVRTATLKRIDEGEPLEFAGVVGRLKIDAQQSGQRFALAHFPEIPPHVLAAPLHRHQNEDEFTYVLEGSLGLQLGDDTLTAEAGTWIVKPRLQWHTFWNPGDRPCRTIEIVSPAGFERYFAELAAIGPAMDRIDQLNAKYAIEMDFESVPALCSRFGLTFPQL